MADGQRQQHGTGPDAIQGWMREGADLAQRSMQVVQQLQRDWDGMAVNDRSWSTDTIMNEVVNSWEHFTPVMGDWIQYGVDGMGIALRSFWPQGPDMLDEMSKRVSQAPNGADAAEYLSVSADAARRMAASQYSSADAVEDFANVTGKATKDAWAAAAQVRRNMPGA